MGILKKLPQLFRRITRRHEFVSIVILLRKPRDLPEDVLRTAAERAWECKFEGSDENPHFVKQKVRHSVVWADGHMLTIANSANPYGDSPVEQAEEMKDLRWRKAWLDQHSFIAIDYVLTSERRLRLQDKYTVVAKLAAELLGDDYTGICLPGEDRIVLARADLENQLRHFSTLEELYG